MGLGLGVEPSSAQAVDGCSKVAVPGEGSAQRLVDSLAPGETGCLRGGSYGDGGEVYVLDPARGGSAGAPITVRSYPGERAKLVGIVILRQGVDHVRLSGLDFEGTGEQNSIKIYSADAVVEDSDITNFSRGRSCMILGSNSGVGQAVRTIVRRNKFHECGSPSNLEARDHSIYTASMVDGQIVDNVMYNPAAYAIILRPNAQRNLIAHNVIDGASALDRGGIALGSDASYASNDNVIEYNVIAYAETYNITTSWSGAVGSGNVARNNCLWAGESGNISTQTGFTATANTIADPGFANRAAHDYRLAPDSPCLATVGYDTAAKLAGVTAPAPAPAPEPAPSNAPPTVTLTSPTDGSTFTSNVSMTAGANDDHGVTKVEFYFNGSLKATDTTAPYSYSFKVHRKTAYGTHTVEAKAYDAAGLTARSSAAVTRVNSTTSTSLNVSSGTSVASSSRGRRLLSSTSKLLGRVRGASQGRVVVRVQRRDARTRRWVGRGTRRLRLDSRGRFAARALRSEASGVWRAQGIYRGGDGTLPSRSAWRVFRVR